MSVYKYHENVRGSKKRDFCRCLICYDMWIQFSDTELLIKIGYFQMAVEKA